MAYMVLFDREADASALEHYGSRLEDGTMERKDIVRVLMDSQEFRERFKPSFGERLNTLRARCQETLPRGGIVVDVAGVRAGDPRGGLLAMGFPHRPARTIVTGRLPESMTGAPEDFAATHCIYCDHGTIEYTDASPFDFSSLPEAGVDLVWAGDSVQRWTSEELQGVLKSAMRVLRPGGVIAFDTPNAVVARIQSPGAPLSPDHRHEYTPDELAGFVKEAGFEVAEVRAVGTMPRSCQTRVFRPDEIYDDPTGTPDPATGYFFFLAARKPEEG